MPATSSPTPVDLRLHAQPGYGSAGSGASAPSASIAGDALTGALAEVGGQRFPLRKIGGGAYAYKGKGFSARVTPDGRVAFEDKHLQDPELFKDGVIFSVRFDITDELMRAHGNDRYRAEKQAFLDATRALRDALADQARTLRRSASVEQLPAHLDSIWRMTIAARERRALLHEIWLDAAESQTDNDSARAACEVVERWVRQHLPSESNDFAERPVIIRGKYRGTPHGSVTLTGTTGSRTFSATTDVTQVAPSTLNEPLRYLWARERIADLTSIGTNKEEVRPQVVALGLAYNLLTEFTSFVAIDERVRNPGQPATNVAQPLPLPAGVDDAAVGEGDEPALWVLCALVGMCGLVVARRRRVAS